MRLVKQARGLRIATGLWGEQTYPFSEAFSALIERYYGTGLQKVDVKHAPEAARQEINGWVAEQTEDRIQDIVPVDAIEPDTRLVLANAIWFSGGWASWFSPDATEDGENEALGEQLPDESATTDAERQSHGTLDPPRHLVVRGLYRFVRNPMYLSVTAIVLGEVLLCIDLSFIAPFLLIEPKLRDDRPVFLVKFLPDFGTA